METDHDNESAPLISAPKKISKQNANHEVPAEVNGWVLTGIQVLNSMLGSGILAFPYTLSQTGGVFFAINILLFSTAVLGTSAMLIEAGKRKGILNLSHLTEALFGRVVAQILNACIIASFFGCLFTYFNVIGALGSEVMRQWTGSDGFLTSYSGCMSFVWTCVLPLVMFRSYGELSWVSIGSLAFIVLIVLFVLVEGQVEATGSGGGFEIASALPSTWFSVLEALGTFAYASSVQSLVFEAYLSTKKEDKPLFIKGSLVLAVGLGASLLSCMAAFGYGAFGKDCASDVLTNFDSSKPSVQAAMLLVVLHLALYIPNAFVILRLYVLESVGVNVLALERKRFVAVTVALMLIPLVVMASVPDSDVAGVFSYTIDLTGDIPTGFSCFVLPAALYVKVFADRRSNLWYLACLVVALGAVLMVVCPVVSTVKFVEACRSHDGCSSYG
mmetsp:Transcript_28030/g.56523  ORF Transcript_28030/g.56523 Transcript_28030/m.56523 type:complete len:444 (-) Transcript_28030:394-1725(-)